MTGVFGYQRKCGDPECPYGVCASCPIAEFMDKRGITTREELMAALDDEYGDADKVAED